MALTCLGFLGCSKVSIQFLWLSTERGYSTFGFNETSVVAKLFGHNLGGAR